MHPCALGCNAPAYLINIFSYSFLNTYLFYRHDGIVKEVKAIREHWFRRRIRELFDSKDLKGDSESLTGLLEPGNFEHNVKSIRKEYEAYVLSIGEYDERVFLGDDADEDIGTPAKNVPASTGEFLQLEAD